MTTRHTDAESRNDRKRGWLWYANATWITCAALIALFTVASKFGVFASWAAAEGVRHEISAAADTADRWPSSRRMMWREQHERLAADDSLRNSVIGSQNEIKAELHDIHVLLVRGRR